MTEDEHAPRAPREQRGGGERADASAEHDDVVVLRAHRAGLMRTRGRARPCPAAGDHLDAVVGDPLEHGGEQLVLLEEDALAERGLVVAVEDGDGRLREDGAGIHSGVDEVHGAAGDAHAVRERLRLRVDAGERGEERGVDVDDAVRERVEEDRRDEAHEAGEHDARGAVRAERLDDGGVEGLAARDAPCDR